MISPETMSLSRRMFLADEELGKKDDDHHRKPAQLRRLSLASWRLPRRRRVYAVIAGVILCYLLFSHIVYDPSDDELAAETPLNYASYPISQGVSRPKGPPPLSDGKRDQIKRYYNGPIRFYTLAKSLYSVRGFMGYRQENKIVLFAAANLKCLSDLLPLACEMSRNKLNRVHIALMGRDDISLEGIQEVNSYNESDCSLVWHGTFPCIASRGLHADLVKMPAPTMDLGPRIREWRRA